MNSSKILLVDDKPENLLALESLLRQKGLEIHKSDSGLTALELLLQNDYAVALVDVQMPEMDGFELAELMRGTEKTRRVPIIFVTAGAHSAKNTFQGYDSGAVDFLNKPLDPHIVKSKVQVFLDLAEKSRLIQDQLVETQAALAARDSALREAKEAVQTRDEFLSIASHELKTPLTGLLLQIQMMMSQTKKFRDANAAAGEPAVTATETYLERMDKALSVSYRQGSKLSDLIDELLDLTRIRLGKLVLNKERINLAQLTKDAIERFRQEAAKKGVAISLSGGEAGIFGNWDVLRIEQIVNNLISNALKYGDASPISVVLKGNQHEASLVVSDKGLGIAPEVQEKIFQRFERSQAVNHFSGLGLGLYITRQIVEAHGGRISVKSALKQGAEFTVTLPLADERPAGE